MTSMVTVVMTCSLIAVMTCTLAVVMTCTLIAVMTYTLTVPTRINGTGLSGPKFGGNLKVRPLVFDLVLSLNCVRP